MSRFSLPWFRCHAEYRFGFAEMSPVVLVQAANSSDLKMGAAFFIFHLTSAVLLWCV